MFPKLEVCWVQLRISLCWFSQQAMENAALEPPNLVELLNKIQLHMPWELTSLRIITTLTHPRQLQPRK
jgi:hypothetical protein